MIHLAAFTLLLLIWLMPAGSAYYEDISTAKTSDHSTFHYEMTRTLARAAGFTAQDAEWIACVDQAVDVAAFKGEFSWSPSVWIRSTGRLGPDHHYYHFPRRRSMNSTSEYAYPGKHDTCAYFAGTADPCPAWSEVDELERWAVYGIGQPSAGVPRISVDKKLYKPIDGQTTSALAVYLHSLADSYSHEACMKSTHQRDHASSPSACTLEEWHLDKEYGPEDKNPGTVYTRQAGQATWLALRWYRIQNGLSGKPYWSNSQAKAFIDQWARLDKAADRRSLAVTKFNSMH
ncbi:MAG: DUF6765 family protein [Acidobacteriota bacterium]